MPLEITLIHKVKKSKHVMPFKQAEQVLLEQVGKHASKVVFGIEDEFKFNGTDIIRKKEA